jgi:hypothetical protein
MIDPVPFAELRWPGELGVYHLGGISIADGTLMGSQDLQAHRQPNVDFSAPQREYTSPSDKDDHPELDTLTEAVEDIKHMEASSDSFQGNLSVRREHLLCNHVYGEISYCPKDRSS